MNFPSTKLNILSLTGACGLRAVVRVSMWVWTLCYTNPRIHHSPKGVWVFFFFFFFFKDQPITWPPTWLKPFGTLPIKTKLDRWTRLSGLLHTHSDGGGGGREVKAHDPFKKKRLKCKIYLLNFTIFYFNSLSLSFVISIY